jgi:hypothetical protein
MGKPTKHLGKLSPQYIFFLNPYNDLRFSRCPQCNGKTHSRKLPMVIWVDPANPVVLNYTCRYCPTDDLLIAHQNEIEGLLARLFAHRSPNVIGNDYLVLGTMEPTARKQGVQKPLGLQNMPEYVHDFNRWSSSSHIMVGLPRSLRPSPQRLRLRICPRDRLPL